MSRKQGVITGIGAVTPAGIGWANNWQSVLSGRSGIRAITSFKTKGFRTTIAGEVTDFDPRSFIDEKLLDNTERFTQLAMAAAQLAIQDARLTLQGEHRDIGIVIGCGMGGLPFYETQANVFAKKGPGSLRPSSVPRIMPNSAAAYLATRWKLRGPNVTISTACSSSNHAVGCALDMIRAERCKMVLCGGTESLFSPVTFAAFDALKVMSRHNAAPQHACRPFDKHRDGFVMGEGAVIFIVEELRHAEARGATIYAEVAGYGSSSGTHSILAPEPDGAEAKESMEAALHDAGVKPQEVDYIHAHGTGTRQNDVMETLAIKNTFGAHARKLLVSSTKPITGHMLGTAGAMGILVCALAIKNGIVPPTLNLETPDIICDLDYVPGTSRRATVRAALSNAFAFGNNNATILLK